MSEYRVESSPVDKKELDLIGCLALQEAGGYFKQMKLKPIPIQGKHNCLDFLHVETC